MDALWRAQKMLAPPGKKSYGLTLINLKRTKMTERSLDKLGIGRADATIDAHAQELSQTANTGMVIFTVLTLLIRFKVLACATASLNGV